MGSYYWRHNFEEYEPEIVEYMIKFLYDGTYKVFARMNKLTAPEMTQNATSSAESYASSFGEPSNKSPPPRLHAQSSANTMAGGPGGLFGQGADMSSSSNGASIFAPTDAPGDTRGNVFDLTPAIFDPHREFYPTNTFAAAAGSVASISNSYSYVWGGNIDTGNFPVQGSESRYGWLGTGLSSIKFSAVDLIKYAKVYILAEKYDIQPLKTLARETYFTILKTCWYSSYFVESIEIIFDGTPEISGGDCLRNSIVETASRHVKQLLARKDFTQLCQERGDIATSILQSVVM
ncbi:hypothetical protein sscle_11g084150 [Sclerotinia sclerotiorum 1980 UF-70]|uniref:BTB domain-containing protein n=1 Tax=Sclerotinia sclerotiorum (strain ATCC 18683 / 1980 / Ss-1) TaxID=665079 RepID=A0A1D9QFD3_SCLS1|nr:hypothetical protein sscle_11g084150 [Sclerotinia sclerotiorum 1980 UF-70]